MKKLIIYTLGTGITLLIVISTIMVTKTPVSQSTISTPETEILNVAHRGASGHAPEHTLLSYEMGEEMNGHYIEIDLQMTKDGELIAMHDEKVDRTTDGTGVVKEMTLKEIKALDAGSWFNETYPEYAKEEYVGIEVPTLREVFDQFGTDANYYIETKSPLVYPGMEEELLQVLEEYKLTGENGHSSQVMIQSFYPESLAKIHKMNPELPLIQLIYYSTPAQISDDQLRSIKEYAAGVGMSFLQINEEYVKKVRESGLLIHPYTVNTTEDMRKAVEWGVTGLFTDFPDRFDEVLQEYKSDK
ncbi:glycerophosphodiester phosphodiesterase [Bacillus sp. AK128]